MPADFKKRVDNKYRIYDIANSSGGWKKSSPDAHNAYVTSINVKFDKKIKPLVRFIKAWKYLRNVPISSFYLELRVAKYASGEKSIIYSIDVLRILKKLLDLKLAAIQDPMGISGYIIACSTESKREDALSKLETALIRAVKAMEAEKEGNISDAFYWWNLVFNDKFPAYG